MKLTPAHRFITALFLSLAFFASVHAQINAAFSYQAVCNGSVSFTAAQQAYTSYTWNFGDNTTATGPRVTHQYAQGNYMVMLTVLNAGDSNSYSAPLFVGQFIQQQITGPADVCTGTSASYSLTNPSGSLQYTWMVSGATLSGNSHSDSVEASFASAGAAVLSVLISNGAGCDSMIKENITVHQTPHLTLPGHTNDTSQTQFTICQNTPGWYHVLSNVPGNITWSSTGGVTLSAQGVDSMLFNFPNAGNASIQITETTPAGCTDTATAVVTISANPVIAATSVNACLGSSNDFIATANPVGSALTYQWIFDDGTQSAGTYVAHTFATAGQHSAEVIGINQNGCIDTASATAHVDVNPGPVITCVGPVCTGAQEVYSTPTVAGVSYHWTITGGLITAGGGLTDNTVAVTWGAGAMGTVSLFLTGPGTYCAVPTTENVPIVGGAFTMQGPANPCWYSYVTYSTEIVPGGIYTWTASTGSIVSGQGTNQIQMEFYNTTPGTISVNINHQILTCSSSASLAVTPAGLFSVYGPTKACVGIQTNFSTYATGSFNWTVTGGTIVSGNGTNSIEVLWNTAGTYNVKAQISTGYCNTEADVNITVVPRKSETILGNATTCAGSSETYSISPHESSYSWLVSQGGAISGSANSNSLNVTWGASPGNDTVGVIYDDMNGCPDTAYYLVNVAPQDVPVIAGDTVACYGAILNYSFTPVTRVNYVWETQGGVITSGQGTSTVSVMWTGIQAGLLRLRNTACNTFRQTNIVIRPTPSIYIETLNLTCNGSSVDLKVVEDYPGYSWSNGMNTQDIQITTAAIYMVTVTDSKGCTASATENANPIPGNGFVYSSILVFTPTPPYPYPYLILTAVGSPAPTSYLWSTGNTEQTQYASTTGTYTVTMTNQYGCTAAQSINVTATNGSCQGGGGVCNGNGVILPCPGISPVFTTNSPVCNPMQFTPGVTAVYYLWNFNDGVYSTLSNPTHRFTSAGTKTVILTYSNDGNNWYQCSQSFVINSVMNIDFTSAGACNGATTLTNISNSALPVSSVLWAFGDGTTSPVTPLVNHQYPNTSPTYQVTLTLNDGVCTDFVQRQIAIDQLVADFTYADVCKDNPALFNDVTTHSNIIASYSWNFGNGETADYYDPITYFHTVANYPVSLSVTDANGCSSIATQSVPVNQFVTLPVTAGGQLTFCKGASVDLSLPTGYIIYWNTGDTGTTIHVTLAGTYFAWAKDAATGCSGFSDTVTVIVNIPPSAFIGNPSGISEICAGTIFSLNGLPYSGVSYQWYLNGVTLSTTNNLWYWSATTNQTGDYQLVITDGNGCKDTSAITHIDINPVPATPSITQTPGGSVCSGQPVTLSVRGPDLYQWSNGTGGNQTTIYQNGFYNVVATNGFGCTNNSYANVNFAATPDFTLFPTGCYQICQSSNVTVSGPAGMQTYLWSTGANTPSITLSASGTYSLSATGADGCSAQSSSFSIDVFGSANLDLGNDTTICAGQTLILQAGVYPIIKWQDNSANQPFTVVDSGLYYVQVTTSQGCVSSDSIHVNVDTVMAELGNDTTVCNSVHLPLNINGNFTSIVWQDGSIGATYAATHSGLYYVNVTDAFGCKASDSIRVNTVSDSINLGNDTALCNNNNNTLQLHVNGNFASIIWQDGSTGNNYTVNQTGLYFVHASDASGCLAADSIVVTIHAPTVELGNDTTLCSQSTLLLNVPGNFVSIVWQNNSTGDTYIVHHSGLYFVNVTDSFGCKASDSIEVSYYPEIQFTCQPTEHLCDSVLTLSAGGPFNSYFWNTGATTEATNVSWPGIYYVTVTDNNGCIASDSINVLSCDTNLCRGRYFIPNVFTPNGDGHNDEFGLIRKPNTEPSQYFSISIFNRIGELVFETDNEMNTWDGKYKGKEAAQGVYVYMAKYLCQGDNIDIKGAITLLR